MCCGSRLFLQTIRCHVSNGSPQNTYINNNNADTWTILNPVAISLPCARIYVDGWNNFCSLDFGKYLTGTSRKWTLCFVHFIVCTNKHEIKCRFRIVCFGQSAGTITWSTQTIDIKSPVSSTTMVISSYLFQLLADIKNKRDEREKNRKTPIPPTQCYSFWQSHPHKKTKINAIFSVCFRAILSIILHATPRT